MISRMIAVASLVTLAASSPGRAEPCAVPTLAVRSMTNPNTVIEDGGGVIVAAVSSFGSMPNSEEIARDKADEPDVEIRSSWSFLVAGKRVTPKIDKLAPGLAVYRLPVQASTTYVLETGTHKSIVTVRRSPDRDASVLPAPVVVGGGAASIEGFRFNSTFVTVHLATTPPKGSAMLVAYGPDGRPRSFGAITPVSKDVQVWRTRGGCEHPIAGEIATSAGDTITVAWLDESGRLSAKSAPFRITQDKQGKRSP